MFYLHEGPAPEVVAAAAAAFGLAEGEWVLVTPEGGHGIVALRAEPDNGVDGEPGWDIAFAFDAIPGAPELQVVAEPSRWDEVEQDWAPAPPSSVRPERS
ncbi:hypothetical protein LO763_25565 [Glycomyces sp. A-F 0318]|uniref:hypothetical protein n=1 Tax=Glycomyces amatae TaxID=2881355 RepID=UPI001E3A63F9|nr:hypothetical protein [Glycomyces amatae]MCD0446991.1 hypothetical protein [Glycomyces amatae]